MGLGYPDPELADGVIRLRAWTFDDLGCVEEASTDPQIVATTTVPAHWSQLEGRAFVERQWSRVDAGDGISLAIHDEQKGRVVGALAMNLRPQPGVIGLGYWIVPDARRRGIASRAAALASGWAIGPRGFSRIEAWVLPDNSASQSVLTHSGFEYEGCLRSFLAFGGARTDVLVYSRVA